MGIQNSDYIKMVEAAIRAPSGHNSQPWLFRLMEDSITILPNMEESLSVVDNSNRELFISLGAATENLCIEASSLGYEPEVSIDEIENNIIIGLKKNGNIELDSLRDAIATRQTNRKVYNNEMITDNAMLELNGLPLPMNVNRYIVSKNDSLFKVLKLYVEEGNQIQMTNNAFKEELLKYIRFNETEIKNDPTGLTYKVLGAPPMPSVISRFITKFFLKPNRQNKEDLKKIESSSHLVLFTTKNDTLPEWINVGRDLQRFILTATRLGIASAYMNQPCEVDKLSQNMKKNIAVIKGEYPTLLLRIGYAEPAPYSPRRKVKDVIV